MFILRVMGEQLALMETRPANWRLSEKTRRAGLAGLAEARAALQAGVERAERRRVAMAEAAASTHVAA